MPGLPVDYEVRMGVESDTASYIFLWERETGIHGFGAEVYRELPLKVEINDKRLKTEFEWYAREVKDINYQTLRMAYPFKMHGSAWETGVAINTDYWRDPALMISVGVKYKEAYSLQIETNLEDRDYISQRLSKRYQAEGSKVYVEPLAVYRIANGEEFWQVKVETGYIFK